MTASLSRALGATLFTGFLLAASALPAAAQSAAELSMRITTLENQIRQLNGQVETLNHRVRQLELGLPDSSATYGASGDGGAPPMDGSGDYVAPGGQGFPPATASTCPVPSRAMPASSSREATAAWRSSRAAAASVAPIRLPPACRASRRC